MVSPQKQIFKCFGCGVGGNIFSFVQEIEKIDFWDAVKLLAEQNHIYISQFQTSSAYSQYAQDEKEKMKRMHKLAQEFFVEGLVKDENAMNYLKEKRKLSDEIISEFWIGFASDKHYELLQFLRSKGFSDEDLVQASLAKKNMNGDIYAFFRNRIIFPIFDLMKNVVGFTARVINPEDQPKYLNSAEHKAFDKSKILYGLSHAKPHLNAFGKLIVVEGQMDVIGLRRLDFPIGIATSGTALTEEHIKILKRYTENIFFLFDNDKAWQQATFRAMKLCYRQDIFPKIINLPEGYKDVDDLANLENGRQLFEEGLEKAEDGFSAMFERFRANSDMSSPVDKQKLVNAMFEMIIAVGNLTIQEHYKILLAEKLGFAPEIINLQFQKYKNGEGKILLRQQERQEELSKPSDRYHPSRELLFSSLFHQEFLQRACSCHSEPTNVGENSLWNQNSFETDKGNSPDKDSSFASLPQNDDMQEFVNALTTFSMQIAVAVPESYLARTFKGELNERELGEVNELQLWREKELGDVGEQDTKKAVIQRVISPSIQEYFKIGSKSAHLSNEEKMELNKLRIIIGRK